MTTTSIDRLQVRRGKMRFLRFGNPDPVTQDNRAAPARRGLWAFPWPINDAFFTWHKWDEVLPKDLRMHPFGSPQRNRQEFIVDLADTAFDDPDQRWDARAKWIRDVGHDVLRVTSVWWDGPVWARFDRAGNVHPGDWYSFSAPTAGYLKVLRRQLTSSHASQITCGYGYSADHLEVFLPA